MKVLISLLLGYLCGSFLTAEAVVRKKTGESVFHMGSGNPGMANVIAQCGLRAGLTVLLGDILKTVIPFFLVKMIGWWTEMPAAEEVVLEIFACAGVITGHNYPFWHRFRGGKGVTATCASMILLMPLWGTASCIAGGLITLLTGYLPLGAVLIPLFGSASAFMFCGKRYGAFMLYALVMMCIRHRHGIQRVFRGEEPRKFRKGTE